MRYFLHGPVTGGSADDGKLQMVWWTLVELLSTPAQSAFGGLMMAYKVLSVMAQFIGFAMMFAAVGFACTGPMVWGPYGWLQRFALRHAAWLMELRCRALVKPSLWVAWLILKKEIAYLHERYRESGQRGDFIVDVENVYGCLDEYQTGGNHPVGVGVLDSPDPRPPEAPEEEPFQGVDLAETALNHVYQLNGRNVDQTVGETEADDRANTTRGVHGTHVEEEDDKMEVDETPAERRARYMSSSQEEVSDPEERAETHYGNLDVNNYERMVAFSRASQLRLRSVLESLGMRRNIAEVDGNWEEASNYSRAMAEIEALIDIA